MILARVASGGKSFDAYAFVKKPPALFKVPSECSQERILTVIRWKEEGTLGS